jgi:hypothetical protein
MPWIKRLDQALESAALAGRVPAFEDDRERRAEPPLIAGQFSAEGQPELGEPRLGSLETLRVFAFRERQAQVELV